MRNKIDELRAERDKAEERTVTTREKYWDIDGEPASAMVRPNWKNCGPQSRLIMREASCCRLIARIGTIEIWAARSRRLGS
jgi:hypothetical protein